MATSNKDPATAGIKVIAIRTCPILSGNGSTLTYKLGVDDEKKLHLRIHENSGGGVFDESWYLAEDTVQALQAKK